jgi:hypothetical protein
MRFCAAALPTLARHLAGKLHDGALYLPRLQLRYSGQRRCSTAIAILLLVGWKQFVKQDIIPTPIQRVIIGVKCSHFHLRDPSMKGQSWDQFFSVYISIINSLFGSCHCDKETCFEISRHLLFVFRTDDDDYCMLLDIIL